MRHCGLISRIFKVIPLQHQFHCKTCQDQYFLQSKFWSTLMTLDGGNGMIYFGAVRLETKLYFLNYIYRQFLHLVFIYLFKAGEVVHDFRGLLCRKPLHCLTLDPQMEIPKIFHAICFFSNFIFCVTLCIGLIPQSVAVTITVKIASLNFVKHV